MSSGLEAGGIRASGGAWWGMGVGSAPPPCELSITDYARAMAQRERILDEAQVRKRGDALSGDLGGAWARLREHAGRFGLPFVEGDLDETNRVRVWEERVLNDAKMQDEWRREFPRAMVRACNVDPEDDAGRSAAAHLESQPTLMWNAFVPLHLRRPGITEELRGYVERARTMPPRAAASSATRAPEEIAVFPGDDVPNLSDFARLQCALQTGDFMTALYREGLHPATYARIADRWARRLADDPALRAEYARVLRRHAELASITETSPLPRSSSSPDALVLPGQKLARVSDFARISRAAQRGEFKIALERAGVDPDTFANLCARFNAKMQQDPVIAEQFQRMLGDPSVDAEEGSSSGPETCRDNVA